MDDERTNFKNGLLGAMYETSLSGTQGHQRMCSTQSIGTRELGTPTLACMFTGSVNRKPSWEILLHEPARI